MADIYRQLRDKFETLGIGYPATETGVEFTLLKRFFSPEDATVFLAMADGYQTSGEFAARSGMDPKVAAHKLEDMAKRGLLFRLREGDQVRYRHVSVVHGLYEFNVNNIGADWLPDFFGHLVGGLGARAYGTDTPFLRSVPLNADVVAESRILPFDDAASIIGRQKMIAVTKCECRAVGALLGNPCKHEVETCIVLGSFAEYYLENKMARPITKEEALAIVKRGTAEGRVVQMLNSKDAECICSCCTCHCGGLQVLGMCGHDQIGRTVSSNYFSVKDESVCRNGCFELCTSACPTGAIHVADQTVVIDVKKCLGCGQCVTHCGLGALVLESKSADKIYEPPATWFDATEGQAKYLADQRRMGKL
jgi:Fe-S-cluster-containing hydrogenase component 2